MRRLIDFLAKLYPSWWRERYGAEFDALVKDQAATMRTAINVLSGALLMQIRTWVKGTAYLRREAPMIGMLMKNWWLLALGGVFEAAMSVVYLIMQSTHGPLTFHAWNGTVAFVGKMAMAA